MSYEIGHTDGESDQNAFFLSFNSALSNFSILGGGKMNQGRGELPFEGRVLVLVDWTYVNQYLVMLDQNHDKLNSSADQYIADQWIVT